MGEKKQFGVSTGVNFLPAPIFNSKNKTILLSQSLTRDKGSSRETDQLPTSSPRGTGLTPPSDHCILQNAGDPASQAGALSTPKSD